MLLQGIISVLRKICIVKILILDLSLRYIYLINIIYLYQQLMINNTVLVSIIQIKISYSRLKNRSVKVPYNLYTNANKHNKQNLNNNHSNKGIKFR